MNILMINPSLQQVCGRTRMSLLLAGKLHQRGYAVSFLTSEDSDRGITDKLPYSVLFGPVSPDQKGLFSTLRLQKAIKRYLVEFQTDIVHTHHRYPAFISGRVVGGSAVAHLTSVHSFIEGKMRIPIKADAWVAVSNAVKSWLSDCYGMEASSIDVIRNGVETLSHKERVVRGTREPFTVLAAGRFSPEKGFDILLNAWELVQGSRRSLKLVIAGAGPEEETLRAMASRMRDTVEICNGAGRMEELYRQCDLVVIPSRNESLSYVLLEAAVQRIPLVCNDTGGPSELISNGKTGLLVEPENPEALASALRTAMQNYDLVSDYASALFEQVSKEHTVDAMTDAYIHVYKRILESRRHYH